MKIAIKVDRKTFQSRCSLVEPKRNEPTAESKQNAQKIIGYKQEGSYFVAVIKKKTNSNRYCGGLLLSIAWKYTTTFLSNF